MEQSPSWENMNNYCMVLLCGAVSLSAIEIDTLERIVVSEKLLATSELSTDQGYRYISLEERRGERTLGELLATVPGVSVKHSGGVGAFETVSIRGVDGSRVAICVDGVPVQSAMGGPVDLSRFSLDNCEGVEIFRGIAPARFGGNSLGGVINLIAKKKTTDSKSIDLLVGSFSELKTCAGFVTTAGSSKVRGTATYHRAQNDFPYLDRSGTADKSSDDTVRTLKNNGYSEFNGLFGYELPTKPGVLTASWETRDKRLEIPAREGSENQTAQSFERENRFTLGLSQKGVVNLNHTLTASINNDRLIWTGLDNFGSVHGMVKLGEFAELKSHLILTDYRMGYQIFPSDKMTISGTVSGRFEQMIPSTDVASFGIGEWKSSRFSGSNATDLSLNFGKFTSTLGGSITVYRSHTEGGKDPYTLKVLNTETTIETDPSGRVGLSFSPIEPLSFFANGAIYSRTPSLRERFGYQGGVLPAPDLKRESGRNVELGGSFTKDNLSGELLFFANHFNEMITIITYTHAAQAGNISENWTLGIEQSVQWKALKWLAVHESMTLQKPENLSQIYNYKGKYLPNQVPFSVNGDITVGPFAGFSVTPELKWQSLLYRDLANTQLYPAVEGSKGKLDLSVYAKWNRDWFTISGSVRNIIDGKASSDARYSMENGYVRMPYPGRTWQMEIRTEF